MISPRAQALLQAASTIYGGLLASPNFDPGERGAVQVSLDDAYALLDSITAKEKALYGTRGCGCGEGQVCEQCPSGKHRYCGHTHDHRTTPCPPMER